MKGKPRRSHIGGWLVSDAAKHYGLRLEDARFAEIKFALGAAVRQYREARGLTQSALASRLHSSQSRVAKMEAGDASVTVDLMIRSLLEMGARARNIGAVIQAPRPQQIRILRAQLRRRG